MNDRTFCRGEQVTVLMTVKGFKTNERHGYEAYVLETPGSEIGSSEIVVHSSAILGKHIPEEPWEADFVTDFEDIRWYPEIVEQANEDHDVVVDWVEHEEFGYNHKTQPKPRRMSWQELVEAQSTPLRAYKEVPL